MKKCRIMFLLVTILTLLCGCKNNEPKEDGDVYQIYEMNKEETTIRSREYVSHEMDTQMLVEELLEALKQPPQNTEMRAVITDPVELKDFSVTDETVMLDFGDTYNDMSLTGEVLFRAAIVRTLTQIDGINYVSVTVNGSPLNNMSGAPIGMMTAEQFIDNSGNEINTEEKVNLNLYFANAAGDRLVKVNREIIYNSNISLEKLVMEQLVLGTHADETEQYGVGMTINPDTKVVSVMVSDGICYVNLDSSFLTQLGNVTPEVTIYSIVNSLVELPNINKVQFLINGENEIMFKETLSFSETYERNLEIVEGS